MEKIGIVGSTGSIGTNGLDVISRFPERFKVSYLSTFSNIRLLSEQIKKFRPEAVCVGDVDKVKEFKGTLKGKRIRLYEGEEALCEMLKGIKVDTLLVGIVGSAALLPIVSAFASIKKLALANKEALVMAGNILMEKASRKKVKILPVDSEHSAIFQCIASCRNSEIKRIYLTGSGGPLLNTAGKDFKNITPDEAVNHPKWKMGRKISVDSATLMNKGLEVIEAHHLFGVGVERIDVLIHPETMVHSMVEFTDDSILAQMGICDMRIPIQYALTYPARLTSSAKGMDISRFKALHFSLPDVKRFPCLRLAYQAAMDGGTYPCVLNASNEVAVEQFLKKRIRFTDIPKVIEKVLGLHNSVEDPGLEEILNADRWAREEAKKLIKGHCEAS